MPQCPTSRGELCHHLIYFFKGMLKYNHECVVLDLCLIFVSKVNSNNETCHQKGKRHSTFNPNPVYWCLRQASLLPNHVITCPIFDVSFVAHFVYSFSVFLP